MVLVQTQVAPLLVLAPGEPPEGVDELIQQP
jgi:hypothetical protein